MHPIVGSLVHLDEPKKTSCNHSGGAMKTPTLPRREKVLLPQAPASAKSVLLSDEKRKAISEQLWCALQEHHFWLTDETVDIIEGRTGSYYHNRVCNRFLTPISLREALYELSLFGDSRRGMVRLSSGGRIFFNFSDRPRFTLRSIQLPVDGRRLPPAFSYEEFEMD